MSLLGRRELLGAVLLAAVALGAWLTSPDAALGALSGLADRPALFAGLLAAVYLLRPLVAWPTMGVSAAVGFVLGPVAGTPVAVVGTVVTSMPVFLAARWFEGSAGVLGRLAEHGRSYFRTAGDVRGVVAARLAPVPADAVSCAAGLSGVGVAAFAVGTAAGELPWTVAAVLVGASAREVTAGGLSSVGLPLAVAATLAAGALLAGPAYRRVAGDADAGG